MVYFLTSIVALFFGPLLLKIIGERRQVLQFLDALVLISIGTLVLGAFLPHAFEQGGWSTVIMFLLGLSVPSFAEKLKGAVHENVHTAAVYVGMAALVLHAIADGVAFAARGIEGQAALALAVLLHRVPVGLAVWWLVRTTHGTRGALLVLLAIAGATGVGYGLGVNIGIIHSTGFMLVLAFVAGSLFHVLMHQHLPAELVDEDRHYRWPEFLGVAVAMIAIVLSIQLGQFEGGSGHSDAGVGARFMHYAIESAPALLLGYVLAGLIVFFLPTASVNWLGRGKKVGQAGRGILFGLPLPICSCGVVPLYDGLVKAGVPAAAGLAFLVATPELGIEAFMLSFPLLGLELTVVRLIAAAVLAFGVALVVSGYVSPVEKQKELTLSLADNDGSGIRRVASAIKYGLVDVLDDTAVWVLAGISIAAFLSPDAIQPLVSGLPWGVDVLLCAVIGIPMYVCASGATPLAAALIAGGVSPGAAITFLLSGPATNVTTFGMLSKIHSRNVAIAFGLSVIGIATLTGLTANMLLTTISLSPAIQSMDHGIVGWIALFILAIAFMGAVLRQGPRDFMSTLFEFGGGHSEADHDDGGAEAGHCCSHVA